MTYEDSSKFKGHGQMIFDLRLAGVKGISDKLPEADLIHHFNVWIIKSSIVQDIEESRRLGINRSRKENTGKFK